MPMGNLPAVREMFMRKEKVKTAVCKDELRTRML